MNIPGWLQDAGSHERPWWLKTHEEAGRAPPGWGRYELPVFAPTLPPPEAVSPGSAASPSGKRSKPRKGGSRSAGAHGGCEPKQQAKQEDAPPAPPGGRPLTPGSHVRQMQAFKSKPLKVHACDEYNRLFWYPPTSLNAQLGKDIDDKTRRGPDAKEGLGRRRKVEGSLDSDYLQACREVEQGWEEDKLRRARSEPSFGHKPHGTNPSMISKKVTAGMTSGTTMCLKHSMPKSLHREEKRQIGGYEDDFPMWHKAYKEPEHGLSQSDVTQFTGAAMAQKVMARPANQLVKPRHPRTGKEAPPWAP